MESYQRTDLACELMENCKNLKGVEEKVRETRFCKIRSLRICTEEASKRLERPMGNYLTLECGQIHRLSKDDMEGIAHLISGEVRGMAERLSGKKIDSGFSAFIAGLGNRDLTPDAIGPNTASSLTATRHLKDYEARLFESLGCSSVSVFAPGVLGQTGIESPELLKGAIDTVEPDLLIVIDALAAGSCDRLASTIQIGDVGIVPGSGVSNHRCAINKNTMGIPVISIGVPTIVDSSTLVWDALQKARINEVDDSLKEVLENGRSFFVSPKESDLITKQVSVLLSRALNLAFVGDLDL